MRVGVLGGTFDPPHYGHLILAEQAHQQLDLHHVLWVPAADPPHKQDIPITPSKHRVEMVARAIADNEAFALSRVDVDRAGPQYAVDMLERLAGQLPDAELTFLFGGDSLRDLLTWHEPQRLLDHAALAVMQRPGADYDLDVIAAELPGLTDHLTFIEGPWVGIAGSMLRDMVRRGCSLRYLVPSAVEAYIVEQGLYRA